MAKRRKQSSKSLVITLILVLLITIYYNFESEIKIFIYKTFFNYPTYTIGDIPKYEGKDYIYINDNIPEFIDADKKTESFEQYSKLDFLGRCGVAYANIGIDLMPQSDREDISGITPSGYIQASYEEVDGKYLYNRCHLIGFQLTGENDNPKNLITCTSHMNKEVMLIFENKVADYIKRTKNHVLYRVTPIFEGANLVATGVQMEALSVEDNGLGIKFNVFIYNNEEGININYANGESTLA